ncbi:unnamed protein product [Peronospora belbahrii]|uniref:Uncharacterized protein n=1 Tax=Peronospora belbahrii TaxID=622444 RepID=A0ABN8CWX2_9STRA|nr:unnamed protein product [Peronospora belbahrii]
MGQTRCCSRDRTRVRSMVSSPVHLHGKLQSHVMVFAIQASLHIRRRFGSIASAYADFMLMAIDPHTASNADVSQILSCLTTLPYRLQLHGTPQPG